jgi:hypothetical protein
MREHDLCGCGDDGPEISFLQYLCKNPPLPNIIIEKVSIVYPHSEKSEERCLVCVSGYTFSTVTPIDLENLEPSEMVLMAEIKGHTVNAYKSNRNRYFWDLFMERLDKIVEDYNNLYEGQIVVTCFLK